MNETLFQLLTAISLAATAIAGVIAALKYRSDLRDAQRLRWQKATVQKIFQKSDDVLNFEDIRLHHRSEAAGKMGRMLDSSDIEEDSLRQILVDLCAANVIVQMGKDTYSLSTYLSSMQDMQKTNTKIQETTAEMNRTTTEMNQTNKKLAEVQIDLLTKQGTISSEMLQTQKQALNSTTR